MTRLIPLTQGKFALVDDEDYERVNAVGKWYAHITDRIWYAMHGTGIYMHRFILGATVGQQVDHVDCNGLNNTRSNIRFCTRSQNLMNERKRGGCTSRFKGVWWKTGDRRLGCWASTINDKNGKRIFLGHFANEVDAAIAYDKAALLLFGSFARLNLPKVGSINSSLRNENTI